MFFTKWENKIKKFKKRKIIKKKAIIAVAFTQHMDKLCQGLMWLLTL